MDKKLIVNIEDIRLNRKSKVETTKDDINAILRKVPTVLKYFQKIDIESLEIQDNHFKIVFDKEFVYLDNKYINISSKYSTAGSVMQLELYSIYLKEQEALFRGKLKLDYHKEIANYFGTFKYLNAEGEVNMQYTEEFLDFFVSTKQIENIKFLKTLFRLPSKAEEWMYDNVTGNMKLNYLYGRLDSNTLEPIMSHIKGDAVISNAKLTFNKKVAPVKTDKLHITFDKDRLNFDMYKPMYKDISIDGSSVKIENLTSEKDGRVVVNIKAKSRLNEDVLGILKAYDISLPLIQKSGTTKADLTLDIAYNGKLKTDGLFKISNAKVDLKSFEMYTKNAVVTLKDNIVNVKSKSVKNADMIDTQVDLDINIDKRNAKGNLNLNSFLIKEGKSEIISLKNYKLPIKFDFNKDTKISLEKVGVFIDVLKESTNISIPKVSTVYKHSDLLKKLKINDASLVLEVISSDNIGLTAKVNKLDLPLKYNDETVTSLNLKGEIKDNAVLLETDDGNIVIKSENSKTEIFLKNHDVIYKVKEKSNSFNDFRVNLYNSNLFIDDLELFVTKSTFDISKELLSFNGIFTNSSLPFSKDGKKIDTFDVIGSYKDSILKVKTKDNRVDIKIKDDNTLLVKLNAIDFNFNTKGENTYFDRIDVEGINSHILVNDKYRVLADKYLFFKDENITNFELFYDKSKVLYSKNMNDKIKIDANKINDKFINTFFNKEDFVDGGSVNVVATGQGDIINGKVFLKNNRIKNMAILNNIITLVNTSPALINPLLAIPAVFGMVTSDGFNLNGYKITKGKVDFVYNSKDEFLNLKDIKTVGNSVDIEGFSTLNFNTGLIDAKLKLVFMKDYSSIVKVIPLIGYILLGDDKKVATNVEVSGKIEDPKIKSNVLKDSASVPVDIIKRIITSPVKLFESDKKEKPKEESLEQEDIKTKENK